MSRDGRRRPRRRALPALAALAVALTVVVLDDRARAADPPGLLDLLEVEGGKLGWDGIQIGMSLVQAERKLGVTLALDKGVASGCPAYVAGGQRRGASLTLGFPSPKPGAKIEWLRVRFAGEAQVVATGAQLAAALRDKHPAAQWIPPGDQPGIAEADDYTPAYTIEGKEPLAVEFVPSESMTLALRRCLG